MAYKEIIKGNKHVVYLNGYDNFSGVYTYQNFFSCVC